MTSYQRVEHTGNAEVIGGDSSRALVQYEIGDFAADINGEINVWIDARDADRSRNRTWYDGVGYAGIPEASPVPCT